MVYFHADDYGISEKQTQMICDCFKGRLNSVSIMPNSLELQNAIAVIPEQCVRKVVHLNFIEGHCVSETSLIPMLVDENGMFRCTFGMALKYGLSGKAKREEAYNQFCIEIKAQILRVMSMLPDNTLLSIDSHQHLHMIPLVFRALLNVIQELRQLCKLRGIDTVRVSVDPLKPILSMPRMFFRVPFKNHIKWWVLRVLSIGERRKLQQLGARVPVFFGMFFTCQMEEHVVSKLLPKYKAIADKKELDLELMFHPGGIYDDEQLLDATQKELKNFYASKYRLAEYKALLSVDE